jgi:hypothetical protein
MMIDFGQKLFHERFSQLTSPEDKAVLKKILQNTARPNHVEKVVKVFATKFLGEKYLSIHWRYNEGDWFHGACGTKIMGPTKKRICDQVNALKNPKMLALSLFHYLKDQISVLTTIYIACPPSEVKVKVLQFSRNILCPILILCTV